MKSIEETEVLLPDDLSKRINSFLTQLEEIASDGIMSVVLYGGVVKGEFMSGTSDVNIMIVFRKIDVACLDRYSSVIQVGVRDFRLAALLLTERDLISSSKLFPVKFLDMFRFHKVLWGKDVFLSLRISREHVLLRCSQEILNLLMRLRQFYIQRAHRPELLEATLARALSSFLTSLNILIELKIGETASTKASVIDLVERIGLDSGTLRDVLAIKEGKLKPSNEDLRRLYDKFMDIVRDAADMVENVEECE